MRIREEDGRSETTWLICQVFNFCFLIASQVYCDNKDWDKGFDLHKEDWGLRKKAITFSMRISHHMIFLPIPFVKSESTIADGSKLSFRLPTIALRKNMKQDLTWNSFCMEGPLSPPDILRSTYIRHKRRMALIEQIQTPDLKFKKNVYGDKIKGNVASALHRCNNFEPWNLVARCLWTRHEQYYWVGYWVILGCY